MNQQPDPAEQRRVERLKEDYRLTFQSEHGQRVLEDLQVFFESGFPSFRTPDLAEFHPGAASLAAAIRDGQKEVIQRIETYSA